MATVAQLVGAYVKIRDSKKVIQDRHKAELEATNAKLALIESGLLNMLNADGVESMRTENGTAFKKTMVKATVRDRELFFNYVVENDLMHMLSSAVSAPAVREFIEANGEAPPGVAVNTVLTVNIRR